MVKSGRFSFLAGFAACMLLVACAGFKYKYYALKVEHWDGTLIGDKQEHDLPFSVCEPRSDDLNPCVVMLRADFFKMKERYLALEKQCIK